MTSRGNYSPSARTGSAARRDQRAVPADRRARCDRAAGRSARSSSRSRRRSDRRALRRACGRVVPRQRSRMACLGRREHLLLAQRARDRRPTSQDAAEGRRRGRIQVREPRPADRARDQPTASGRGTVARNRSAQDGRRLFRRRCSGPTPTTPSWSRESRGSISPAPGSLSTPVLRASQRWQPVAVEGRRSLRSSSSATFNSGFKLEDSGGGFAASGHVYAPLKDGQATLSADRNGTIDMRTWTGGPDPGRTSSSPPEPASDGRARAAQSGPEQRLAAGYDPRQRRAGLALRDRRRRRRKPHLRGRRRSDRRKPRADTPTRRRRAPAMELDIVLYERTTFPSTYFSARASRRSRCSYTAAATRDPYTRRPRPLRRLRAVERIRPARVAAVALFVANSG